MRPQGTFFKNDSSRKARIYGASGPNRFYLAESEDSMSLRLRQPAGHHVGCAAAVTPEPEHGDFVGGDVGGGGRANPAPAGGETQGAGAGVALEAHDEVATVLHVARGEGEVAREVDQFLAEARAVLIRKCGH